MSNMVMSEKGKEILENILSESEKSPFIKDNNGKLYFKFNKIKIENQSGGIVVNYCWNDLGLFEQRTNGFKFENGSMLILNGIEGRIAVDFNFK